MILYRLSVEASRLVTKELASGQKQSYEPGEYEVFLDECHERHELGELNAVVDELIANTRMFDASIDAEAAPAIHDAFPISRREASGPGVWRFLTVAFRPDFVRHRWENRSWATMRTRFWMPGTRPDSNAFSRLWWIAELTRDGDSYELTRRVLARQSLTNSIFVRNFSFYRPAVEAFAFVLEYASPDVLEAVARRFNAVLSTNTLEGQSYDGLVELLREIRQEVDPEH